MVHCVLYCTLCTVLLSEYYTVHCVLYMQVRSILDYDIDIHPLPPEQQTYTALNMNYSVAGFQVCLHQEMALIIALQNLF